MAKETKTQAMTRLFDNYCRNYNAIPDFNSFLESCSNPKDKKIFTATTFKNYFFKHFEGSKDLAKALKAGEIKRGDIVIDSLTIFQNEIRGQKFGEKKEPETIMSFCRDWGITKGKTLSNKKLGLVIIQDFTFDAGMWGKRHFFISNEFGNHVRYSDAYLNQFVETYNMRKTYELSK